MTVRSRRSRPRVVVPIAVLLIVSLMAWVFISGAGGIPSPSPDFGKWRAFVTVSWKYDWHKKFVYEDVAEVTQVDHSVEWRKMILSTTSLEHNIQLRIGETEKFRLVYALYDRYGNQVASDSFEFHAMEGTDQIGPVFYLKGLESGHYTLKMSLDQWWDVVLGKGWTTKDTAEYSFTLTEPQ